MYLARHYQKKNKWIAAINRYKYILEEYDETIFIEEALHRLVEINYKIGLVDESKKYATLLGYNYQSIKSNEEIKNMVSSHIIDGAALTKFLYWIKMKNKKKITEYEAQKKTGIF